MAEYPHFASVEDVIRALGEQRYVCDSSLATVVFLAASLEKPILVEGPAGVGKSELAKAIAAALDRPLVRLQCYEGLDEAKALYEWEYGKQLLYTQILKEKIGEIVAGTNGLEEAVEKVAQQDDVFFSDRFILARPLLKAIRAEHPTVLLIDEVDKSDSEFEAFLLEVLSDFQVSVPELGTLEAKHIPIVVLTSNAAREMSDALRRRCLHLHIEFPTPELEAEIVRLKIPGIEATLIEELVTAVQSLRSLELKKKPSISETLDWGRSLLLLGATSLDEDAAKQTLSTIVKYEADLRKAQKLLSDRTRPAVVAASASGEA